MAIPFSDQPEFALCSVLQFLPLCELYPGCLLLCKKLNRFLTQDPGLLAVLSDHYLCCGLSPDLPLSAMLSDLTRAHSGLLALRGYFTNGGVMRSWGRFCFHNMFEYSGSVYSTEKRGKVVLTKAYFVGKFGTDCFTYRTNEDQEWKRRGRGVPVKYENNELMDRCEASAQPSYIPGLCYQCKTDMPGHVALDTGVIQEPLPCISKAAVVSKVAICRPGLSTGPVRTLALYSTVGSDPWTSTEPTCSSDLETVLATLPGAYMHSDSSCVYVESVQEPWLWVQFTDFARAQIVIELKRPRCLTHLSVLLLDREDRREDYCMFLKTLDVGYVALFGKVVRLTHQTADFP